MGDTSIQWTDKTWNPVRGCSRVSEGCRNCYAERQAARFSGKRGMLNEDPPVTDWGPFHGFVQITHGHPQWTGKVELVERHLEDPLHWKPVRIHAGNCGKTKLGKQAACTCSGEDKFATRPLKVFVNSMSDLFHEALGADAIARVYAVMYRAAWHTYQVLTKRGWRRKDLFGMKSFWELVSQYAGMKCSPGAPHIWEGISIHDQPAADGDIPDLLQTPAAIRFVSYEPALGPVTFDKWSSDGGGEWRHCIDWLIIGGESGPGARPFDIQWARNTIKQCKAAGVACFVKQLGAKPEGSLQPKLYPNQPIPLKDRKGGDWLEWPEDLRVRDFPEVRNAARV